MGAETVRGFGRYNCFGSPAPLRLSGPPFEVCFRLLRRHACVPVVLSSLLCRSVATAQRQRGESQLEMSKGAILRTAGA